MNNINCKKNKNYYLNNNFYPTRNNCNIYYKKNNNLNQNISSYISNLYDVENFLCDINKIFKCIKLIKFFK